MRSTLVAVMHLMLAASTFVCATDASFTKGINLTSNSIRKAVMKYGYQASRCNLVVPKSVEEQMHPNVNEGNPLNLTVKMRVRNVRDVPDSGGSYGVDVK